ncbi:AAA family ATPase [Oleomonas cavernae]|uniref:AAA family ATPase n=1 Tax=Oleomonas cavernae TaxID=2320859 RepID=UPI001314A1E1|nr:ATP-binding protein [Oleomonas cavernae]
MTRHANIGKPAAAMLHNVGALLEAIERLQGRAEHLPGLGCMFAPSGFGKTVACATAAANKGAIHIEARSSWGKREFLETVALSLGVMPGRTIARTAQAVGDHLREYQPVLLMDEADILVEKGMIELVRELHMVSETPIILVGEEALPNKLKRFERVHNRVLAWVPAQPANLADARQLAEMYVDGIEVADDLLSYIVTERRGRIRKIVTNLEQIQITADRERVTKATRAWWADRSLDTGEAPTRRL